MSSAAVAPLLPALTRILRVLLAGLLAATTLLIGPLPAALLLATLTGLRVLLALLAGSRILLARVTVALARRLICHVLYSMECRPP